MAASVISYKPITYGYTATISALSSTVKTFGIANYLINLVKLLPF